MERRWDDVKSRWEKIIEKRNGNQDDDDDNDDDEGDDDKDQGEHKKGREILRMILFDTLDAIDLQAYIFLSRYIFLMSEIKL